VLIVQHGEKRTEPGDPGLTRVGQAQANCVADHLVRAGSSIARVYSSPLRRALETAEIIGTRLGRPVSADERLRERMNWDRDHFPRIDAFLDDWAAATADRDFQPLYGDSSRAAAARFAEFLDDRTVTSVENTIIVVSHGGVSTDLLRDLLGDHELDRRSFGLIRRGIPNGAITRFSRQGDRWHPDEIAHTAHLNPRHARNS
jgi:broad specificity phosphatase PhoE